MNQIHSRSSDPGFGQRSGHVTSAIGGHGLFLERSACNLPIRPNGTQRNWQWLRTRGRLVPGRHDRPGSRKFPFCMVADMASPTSSHWPQREFEGVAGEDLDRDTTASCSTTLRRHGRLGVRTSGYARSPEAGSLSREQSALPSLGSCRRTSPRTSACTSSSRPTAPTRR